MSALGNAPGGAPLAPGGTFSYVRRLYVGGTNDVRGVSNALVPELASRTGFATGTLSGDVDAADTGDVQAALVVRRLGRCSGGGAACAANAECGGGTCDDPVPTPGFGPGGHATHVRTETDGTFAGVVLPQGDYEVRVSAAERDDVLVRPVTVGAGNTAVEVPPLSARGLLRFTVREKRKGKPALPAKLVLYGADGTPDPRLGRRFAATLGGVDVRAETFGGTERGPEGDARGQGNVVYTTTGSGAVSLRPGTYEVWASRGLEYGIARESVVRIRPVPVPVSKEVRMCEATQVDGEASVAGDDTVVTACQRRVGQALTEAGIPPSPVTGLALLDTAVTLLTFHDIAADALYERVRRRIVDAEDLTITAAFPDARLRAH